MQREPSANPTSALGTRSAASLLLHEFRRQANLLGTLLRRFRGCTIIERARTQQGEIALLRHLLVFFRNFCVLLSHFFVICIAFTLKRKKGDFPLLKIMFFKSNQL